MEGIDFGKLAQDAVNIICAKNGEDIVALDVSGLTSFTDIIIISTLTSSVQIKSVVKEMLRGLNRKPDHVEGDPASGWVLMDYEGMIVNLFLEPLREYYRIERIWGDAREIKLQCMK
jgi:ribosome-associated protein